MSRRSQRPQLLTKNSDPTAFQLTTLHDTTSSTTNTEYSCQGRVHYAMESNTGGAHAGLLRTRLYWCKDGQKSRSSVAELQFTSGLERSGLVLTSAWPDPPAEGMWGPHGWLQLGMENDTSPIARFTARDGLEYRWKRPLSSRFFKCVDAYNRTVGSWEEGMNDGPSMIRLPLDDSIMTVDLILTLTLVRHIDEHGLWPL
ncbi:hypothetical protein BOTBODRAFT_33955 [Botryobasidium botryosum FD-172 SS1]|uniref:Uncharacterized protein n=1 Tax=Botryobasidium botryosum (strain FD-172 SS1) TaxID=930990 RepID=A0A067MNB8_BOTB1|nr:hypothetical protein BOTBODRAFT_33955 [Botryobasidium botryosum FD-172 SS1]